jgi:hypothetical protein
VVDRYQQHEIPQDAGKAVEIRMVVTNRFGRKKHLGTLIPEVVRQELNRSPRASQIPASF